MFHVLCFPLCYLPPFLFAPLSLSFLSFSFLLYSLCLLNALSSVSFPFSLSFPPSYFSTSLLINLFDLISTSRSHQCSVCVASLCWPEAIPHTLSPLISVWVCVCLSACVYVHVCAACVLEWEIKREGDNRCYERKRRDGTCVFICIFIPVSIFISASVCLSAYLRVCVCLSVCTALSCGYKQNQTEKILTGSFALMLSG